MTVRACQSALPTRPVPRDRFSSRALFVTVHLLRLVESGAAGVLHELAQAYAEFALDLVTGCAPRFPAFLARKSDPELRTMGRLSSAPISLVTLDKLMLNAGPVRGLHHDSVKYRTELSRFSQLFRNRVFTFKIMSFRDKCRLFRPKPITESETLVLYHSVLLTRSASCTPR